MFHAQLRQAIAKAFPSSYNRFTWRKLLPEFVNQQLDRLTQQWLYTLRQENTNKTNERPLPQSLPMAATLLARQQNLSYQHLALSHYRQQYQLSALTQEVDQLRQLQKTDLADLFASLTPTLEEDAYRDYLMRIILLQFVGIDQLDLDNQALLASFIEAKKKAYQKRLDEYYEQHTDGDELLPPNPSEELMIGVMLQALFGQQTFPSLAYQAHRLSKENEGLKLHLSTLEKLAAGYKEEYNRLRPLAQKLMEERRKVARYQQQVEECKQGRCLAKRQN